MFTFFKCPKTYLPRMYLTYTVLIRFSPFQKCFKLSNFDTPQLLLQLIHIFFHDIIFKHFHIYFTLIKYISIDFRQILYHVNLNTLSHIIQIYHFL